MASDMNVRLFPDSPEFPAEFLDLIENKQVVFFCGAGLSKGTGLPLFPGLVQNLDKILNPDPTDRFDPKRKDYDRMLNELESGFIPGRMREHVSHILSHPPLPHGPATLENHRNILRLAIIPGGGVRLVTTNFDDRFLRAAKLQRMSIIHDDAPKLPVPESPGWASLVYLHGRIHKNGNLNDLVLNASDFGRAYLSEGWARRFVVRLMRSWSVVFVGYSLDDPPMRYLMDAVYDPRSASEGFKKAFALVGHQEGKEDKKLSEWKRKHVTPIFYNSEDEHAALQRILREFVLLRNGQENYRAKLALQDITGKPNDENGEKGRRAVWALRSPVAAKIFAERQKFAKKTDGGKFINWLDIFEEAKLFHITTDAINMTDCSPEFTSPDAASALCLTEWIARHVHQPMCLKWLAAVHRRGLLHPIFVQQIVANIERERKKIPKKLSELWDIFIHEKSLSPAHHTRAVSIYLNTKNSSDSAKFNVARHILAGLRPQLQIVPTVSPDHKKYGVMPIVTCDINQMKRSNAIKQHIIIKGGFSLKHLEELSSHLEDAASLTQWCGVDMMDLREFHSEKIRDLDIPHWMFLALLVRDGVLGVIKNRETSRLTNLVSRWKTSKHLLLNRLALFALAETKELPADWGAKLLTSYPKILWHSESDPEVCQFLRKAGARIESTLLTKLDRIIRNGPAQMKHPPDSYAVKAVQRKITARLANLKSSKATLSPQSKKMLIAANSQLEMELASQQSASNAKMPKLANLTIAKCVENIRNSEWPPIRDFINEQPSKSIATFEELAKQEFWDTFKWSSFLGGFDFNKDIPNNHAKRLIRLLDRIPDKTALECARPLAGLLWAIARTHPFSSIEFAWRRAWDFDMGPKPKITTKDISSFRAITAVHDKLMEAAWTCARQNDEWDKMLEVFSEILASDKGSHDYGKVAIARETSWLFHNYKEWTQQYLLPFFQREHPMSFDMWASFLGGQKILSVELMRALMPSMLHHIKRPEKFGEFCYHFISIFALECLKFPNIMPKETRRKIVDNMNHEARMMLCQYLRSSQLPNDDSGKQGKIWRQHVGPFLSEIWPERRIPDGKNFWELIYLLIQTGDAFPDAIKWAKDFLNPFPTEGGWNFGDLVFSLSTESENGTSRQITNKFPKECLLLLSRTFPNNYSIDDIFQLEEILKKIKKSSPKLKKHPEYVHLLKIARSK